ncbi:MAG: periplasmic heavy metal sensor [Ramlibacter sp.]
MNPSSFKRWLIASLVLNLFLVGGIAGAAWRWWAAQPVAAAPVAQPRGLRFAADELSPEQRQAFRTGLRDARRDAAASIQASRSGRQELTRLISAPEFDRAAAAATLARTREADIATRTRFEASVIDFASTLAPAERLKLADGLARRSTLGPPRPAQPATPAKP